MDYEIFISEKPKNGREITEINGIPVIKPFQIHSSRIAFVGKHTEHVPQADALVTDNKDVWIGVLTADCLPVFLIGENVVGIVHAGWRGTLKGITYSTVKYINNFSPVKKAILGVCICSKCYEVGEDVYEQFYPRYADCFTPTAENKFLFDLRKANLKQLKAAGVNSIEIINLCTVCNNNRFFSYRLEKTEKRNLSAIRLK